MKIDKISLIIPCYKRLEYTKALVSSIVSKREIEIIIVDDCSEDGTGEWATEQGYNLISHNQRMGVPKCWNDGVKKSLDMGIDYMIISNNDVILHKDCINNLVDYFESKINNSGGRIVGPRTAIDGNSYTKHTGTDISHIRIDTPKAVDIISNLPLPSKYDFNIPLWHFFILSKSLIEKVGYFDENFPSHMYYEDNDFMRRLYLAGLNFGSLSQVLAFHVYSPKYVVDNCEKINLDYYMQKWGGSFMDEKYDIPFNGNIPPNIKKWCL